MVEAHKREITNLIIVSCVAAKLKDGNKSKESVPNDDKVIIEPQTRHEVSKSKAIDFRAETSPQSSIQMVED